MANVSSQDLLAAKLVLLGEMATGKSSLVLRYVKGQFDEYMESTIGAAFLTKQVREHGVKFEIWDTAGQERYHSLAPMYYRGAAAAVVVYDITSKDSFERAKHWIKELKQHGSPQTLIALAGNKCDKSDLRQVTEETGRQYAEEQSLCCFYETSAKDATNVEDLFNTIANSIPRAAPPVQRQAQLNLTQAADARPAQRACCS